MHINRYTSLLKTMFLIILIGAVLFPSGAGYIPIVHAQDFDSPALGLSFSADGVTRLTSFKPKIIVVDPNPAMQGLQVPVEPEVQAAIDAEVANPDAISSTFSITYKAAGTTDPAGSTCLAFPAAAQTAFNAAAAIWANTIRSSVPITISACWSNLGSTTILGYSGYLNYYRDFTGAPLSKTWYGPALANALYGSDLTPSDFDDYITLNSGFSWYTGTNGVVPAGQYDLVTIATHEIGHGLNFSGSASYTSGTGSYGYGTTYPDVYDTFMESSGGTKLTSYTNPSTGLGSLLTSGSLWFNGTNANAANGGSRVRIYAPSTWASGSSYAHLDYTTFAGTINSIMIPAIGSGSANHNLGPVIKGLIQDLGWVLAANTPPEVVSKTSPSDGSTNQPNNPSLNWGISSGATSYEYCIDISSNNTCDASWVSTGTNTSANLSGLALGNHSWQVRAVNNYGKTEANGGAWWSFMVVQSKKVYLPLVLKPLTPPGAFNKTAPANGETNQSTSPSLSWGASSATTGYEYCIDTSNNNTCDSTWISTAANTSVSLSGLTSSASYYWQVRANNAGGTTYADGEAWWYFTTTTPPNTFSSIADACIMQGYADMNFGSTVDMWAGYDDYLNPDGKIVRSLVKFDLSAISTGTTINNATLYLYYLARYDYPGHSRTITTYGVNSSWSEGDVTWNTQPTIGESYGSTSIVADQSWRWVSFDVTSLVRSWVAGSQTNYGILIRGPEVSGSDSSWRAFGTREDAHIPYLSINETGSGSIIHSQPPSGKKVPLGSAESILQILTGETFNPLGPLSCSKPLKSGDAIRCLLVQ